MTEAHVSPVSRKKLVDAATRVALGFPVGLVTFVVLLCMTVGVYVRHALEFRADFWTCVMGGGIGAVIWLTRLRARHAAPLAALGVGAVLTRHYLVYILSGEARLYVPMAVIGSICAAGTGAVCAWVLRLWEAWSGRSGT